MVNLEIKDLTKVYNKKIVLDNISFKVKDGEFLSILGPSGCGKTTLLKILIGIENPTSGKIFKKEKDITKLDPSKREMGIVFQNYALFPNMTVLDNVMYALNLKLKNKEEAKKQALKMIKVVNMEEHIKKYPHELSGGQQQSRPDDPGHCGDLPAGGRHGGFGGNLRGPQRGGGSHRHLHQYAFPEPALRHPVGGRA